MHTQKTIRDLLLIAFVTFLSTFLIWLPFLLKVDSFYGLNFSDGINTIYKNFDGLEYVVIAKSWYNPQIIANLPQTLSANYYAAHFPGFAILIWLMAPFLGFLKSMIFVSLSFTLLSTWAFYYLVTDFKLSKNPVFLSLVFLVLPARWLIVHSVGSAEPVFIFFTIMCLYFFMKYEEVRKWRYIHLCGLFGLLAQLTRPPGILIFVALGFFILWKVLNSEGKNIFKKLADAILRYHPLLLIPLCLLGIFSLYSQTYGDFYAYFHSGDNIHLVFPPFQVFNKNQFWVGEIWLEDVIYIFILGTLGGIYLLKQKILLPLGVFVLTYLGASMLVAHRDISRYTLPIFPFVLIAFEKVLVSKEFRIVLIIVLLAIYLYSENFIIQNVAPIPNLILFN